MKSLQTIQKTFRVFQILVKIGMICSFVWAGLASLGLLCCIVWKVGGAVAGSELEILHSLLTTENLTEAIGVLLTDTLFAVTDGILLILPCAISMRNRKTARRLRNGARIGFCVSGSLPSYCRLRRRSRRPFCAGFFPCRWRASAAGGISTV